MQTPNRRLMLISNSFCYGLGYLEHCSDAIKEILGGIEKILFIPYALTNWNRYLEIARAGFEKMGVKVLGIHECAIDYTAILTASAIFVGGGNTFRLLNELYSRGLLKPITQKVNEGMPYLGASAGANLACPTIKTTNDMPIIYPPSFNALNLVPFQINPHYVDPDPNSKHMGETRDKRISEFHEENSQMVIGIREGSWIKVDHDHAYLGGKTGAKIFSQGAAPVEWNTAEQIRL